MKALKTFDDYVQKDAKETGIETIHMLVKKTVPKKKKEVKVTEADDEDVVEEKEETWGKEDGNSEFEEFEPPVSIPKKKGKTSKSDDDFDLDDDLGLNDDFNLNDDFHYEDEDDF